jgi:ABC-type Fe3+-hydroxamate transport system substrate-binding protein
MKYAPTLVLIGSALLLSACTDADIASSNLSKAADNFEITRRVVFYNGITDSYMLTIEGKCSLGNADTTGQLTVTCKTGPAAYKKHFLGLSDNVTYFVEQLESAQVSAYHYRVKPQTILPDIDFQGSGTELLNGGS